MTKEEVLKIWAPQNSIWSPWVKPVLFAHLSPVHDEERQISSKMVLDLTWLNTLKNNTVAIVDLPSQMSVEFGVALTGSGFRPVPLFNALPGPEGNVQIPRLFTKPSQLPTSLVNVRPIMAAILKYTDVLQSFNLPDNAPPAFLLDANRMKTDGCHLPGRFDNRSCCSITDFPSASSLQKYSIEKVIVVRAERSKPAEDLITALLHWQKAGLKIHLKYLNEPGEPEPTELKQSFFAWLCSVLQSLGLMHNAEGPGSFGRIITSSG